jgi:hypothetical protein
VTRPDTGYESKQIDKSHTEPISISNKNPGNQKVRGKAIAND